MPGVRRHSFCFFSFVALNVQEAQTRLLCVSAFPHVNGECEQHTAVLISAPQAAGNQWTKGKLSPLRLPGSFHTGAVPQMLNKQEFEKARVSSPLGRKFIFHPKMMKHDIVR